MDIILLNQKLGISLIVSANILCYNFRVLIINPFLKFKKKKKRGEKMALKKRFLKSGKNNVFLKKNSYTFRCLMIMSEIM